ncbi:MAG: hypothetical protein H7256_08755 [Bdellovibrio sp.]|nr:hypothetical protein [Bdellovibrio sp.]
MSLNSFAAEPTIQQQRVSLILKAFNNRPENLIRPLVESDIHMGPAGGRVDVNDKAKFSYYIHIAEANDMKSAITLIPMATSRFTPTYYQTDAWWDAHKTELEDAKLKGLPAPKQDMDEVMQWLQEMKLSTNPDVIEINGANGQVRYSKLQTYLLDFYLSKLAKNDKIILFRGAEKPDEISSWQKGVTPRGARYWTPTANYAWRYARKNTKFLDELLANKTPLFKFEIPVTQFKLMVDRKWQQLTLGTELTKKVHDSFDRTGNFQDQLQNNDPYLGEGHFGVEFELRANRQGSADMANFYKGAITIEDLVNDRVSVIERTQERLIKQNSTAKEKYDLLFSQRVERVKQEGMILIALQENYTPETVQLLLSQLIQRSPELVNIDGTDFNSWVRKNIELKAKTGLKATSITEQIQDLKKRLYRKSIPILCEGLF